MMDNHGFIFTLDAVLALIPVFIVIMAVSGVNMGDFVLSEQQVRLGHEAQDTLDVMAQQHNSEEILLEEIANLLNAGQNAKAEMVAEEFMDKNLPGMGYKLVELNQLNGVSIASRGSMEGNDNMAVGTRSYGNYTYRLYVWISNN